MGVRRWVVYRQMSYAKIGDVGAAGLKDDKKPLEGTSRRNKVWRGNGPATGTLKWVVKPHHPKGKGGGRAAAHYRFCGGPKGYRDGRKGGGGSRRGESDKTSSIGESVEEDYDREEPRRGSSAQSTASGSSSLSSEGLPSSKPGKLAASSSTTPSASPSQSCEVVARSSLMAQEPIIPQAMALSTSLRVAWGAMPCTCPECTQEVADLVLKAYAQEKTWTPGSAVEVGRGISSTHAHHGPHGRPSVADRREISSYHPPSSEGGVATKHPCRLRLVGDMSRACREELQYGRCKRGSACRFSHDISHGEGLKRMHKSQMCRWGRNCYFGENCLYSHSQTEIADAQSWLVGGSFDKYARERYLVHQSKMTTDLFTELQRKHQNRYEDPRYGGRGGGGGGGGLIAPMLQQSNVPRLPVYYGGGRGMSRYT